MPTSMTFHRAIFWASLATLSATMVVLSDLFLWSKVVRLPEWAKALPAPLMLPSYLAFVCLLPAALGADSLARACSAVLKVVLWAPLPAMAVAFALSGADLGAMLLFNVAFQYVWILLFYCALPAILSVALRAVLAAVPGRKRD